MSKNNNEFLKPVMNPSDPIDLICPICKSVLNYNSEYDYSNYSCLGCGASYQFGDRDPESLKRQAIIYKKKIMEEVENTSLKLGKLEKIVRTAIHNGV